MGPSIDGPAGDKADTHSLSHRHVHYFAVKFYEQLGDTVSTSVDEIEKRHLEHLSVASNDTHTSNRGPSRAPPQAREEPILATLQLPLCPTKGISKAM